LHDGAKVHRRAWVTHGQSATLASAAPAAAWSTFLQRQRGRDAHSDSDPGSAATATATTTVAEAVAAWEILLAGLTKTERIDMRVATCKMNLQHATRNRNMQETGCNMRYGTYNMPEPRTKSNTRVQTRVGAVEGESRQESWAKMVVHGGKLEFVKIAFAQLGAWRDWFIEWSVASSFVPWATACSRRGIPDHGTDGLLPDEVILFGSIARHAEHLRVEGADFGCRTPRQSRHHTDVPPFSVSAPTTPPLQHPPPIHLGDLVVRHLKFGLQHWRTA
jgi:hypothetical protein